MKNLKLSSQNLLIKAQNKAFMALSKLREKRGSFFTENALVIVITVAIGGLALSIFFGLFKDELAPQLSSKITEFFNYAG